jgi:hypothetical protein
VGGVSGEHQFHDLGRSSGGETVAYLPVSKQWPESPLVTIAEMEIDEHNVKGVASLARAEHNVVDCQLCNTRQISREHDARVLLVLWRPCL